MMIRRSLPLDGARIVEVWRSAVDATHDFLALEDRVEIEEAVQDLLPRLPLWVAVDDADQPIGFMSLNGTHMDALFIDAASRGAGVGRKLVAHALSLQPILTVDVNEQNSQAVGFYERLGFSPTGRSETDDEGRPYPVIHLRLSSHR